MNELKRVINNLGQKHEPTKVLYESGMENLEDVTTIEFEKYGPGKFSNNVEEFVNESAISGFAHRDIEDEYFGVYDLVTFDKPIKVTEDDKSWQFVAAIIYYKDSGFVEVETYKDMDEALTAWDGLELDYEKFLEESDL